jgi:hypothetical protein
MRAIGIAATAALLAAAAANGAYYYLNQNFEGSWLPPGWSIQTATPNGNAGWAQVTGPYGYCARGFAYSYYYQYPCYGFLYSPNFYVPAGTTLYYRFDYARTYGGSSGSTGAGFYLYRGTSPVYMRSLDGLTDWTVASGSTPINTAGSYYGMWMIKAAGTGLNYTYLYLDNVALSDELVEAAAPASLGRVKALFR